MCRYPILVLLVLLAFFERVWLNDVQDGQTREISFCGQLESSIPMGQSKSNGSTPDKAPEYVEDSCDSRWTTCSNLVAQAIPGVSQSDDPVVHRQNRMSFSKYPFC